jgi:hypothetical protein
MFMDIDNREALRRELAKINPECDEFPKGVNWDAMQLQKNNLIERLNIDVAVGFKEGSSIQDATYFASIVCPLSIRRPEAQARDYIPVIGLSNFEHLVTILRYEDIQESVLADIIDVLRKTGYWYIPIDTFDEDVLDDLWIQLFDYI